MARAVETQMVSQFLQDVRRAGSVVAEESDSDVFVYNGYLESPADVIAIRKCKESRKRDNVLLILATYGGVAEVAYRLGRYLQQNYKKRSVLIPSKCKSAGTLLAIAADELVLLPESELGPLDVQMRKSGELGERESGLTILQTLESLQGKAFEAFEDYLVDLRVKSGYQIMTKDALETAERLTVGLFSPIYAQIDPIRIGENSRGLLIAEEYGQRLNIESGILKEGALARLIRSYPSHDFVIDRQECETIFKDIRFPTDAEMALLEAFGTRLDSPYVPKRELDSPMIFLVVTKEDSQELAGASTSSVENRQTEPTKDAEAEKNGSEDSVDASKKGDTDNAAQPQERDSGNSAGESAEALRALAPARA